MSRSGDSREVQQRERVLGSQLGIEATISK